MEINPELLNEILNRSIHHKDRIFFIYNPEDEKFQFLSEGVENIWGSSKALFLTHPEIFFNTIVLDDRNFLRKKFKSITTESDEAEFEVKIKLENDQRKWIKLKIQGHRKDENAPLLIFANGEDISLRKEYELNLLNINERKNNVLQIIGHDLRGPLQNIKRFTDLLEKEYEAQQFNDFETYIKYMRQSCQNSINLISELLTLEFMQSDQVELKYTCIELVSRFNIIFDTYRLAEKDLQKNFIIESFSEKVFIEADELKFMLIFSNLISNAYKFTPESGTIIVKIRELDNSVIISVEDDGIGIPENLQPYLFDKFTKARRPGRRGESPVGLGLHIIKYMVELHKGNIWFESKENEGTKFFVEVPK